MLKKTVNDGLFANYSHNEDKPWARFMGQYTVDYDDNGIVEGTSAIFTVGGITGPENKVELTIADGSVTEAVRTRNTYTTAEDEDPVFDNEYKFVFEYTDTEISRERYAAMMNSLIMDPQNNYYIYNWY